jgi:hypothetical protein
MKKLLERLFKKEEPKETIVPYEPNKDPRFIEKTGTRKYRVREIKYDTYSLFRPEYLIEGLEQWECPTEARYVQFGHNPTGVLTNIQCPLEFDTLTDAEEWCQKDKKVRRNESVVSENYYYNVGFK